MTGDVYCSGGCAACCRNVGGVHRNPQTVPLPKASGIASSEKPQFRLQSSRLAAQMTMFAEAATLASSNVF